MEKSTKNASSGSKGATSSDGKAKQDGTNKYTRTSKHKDSIYSRPEPPRRPIPQRNRNAYDKRPRSRSGYSTDRDRGEVAQIEKFEAVSATKQGSKKLNLTHLLNFTLTPPRVGNEYRPGSWQGGRNIRKQKLPKYNKEQFLQANCQFVVKEEGDYSIHGTNPDRLVDWSLVEEIHLPSHQVPSCPICLYPPVAAKITRCGHIYCWSCLLHYLSLSDKSWRKCPICYEAIHKNDLKSVVSTSKTTYTTGDTITMCLMKRKRGSVISKPVDQFSLSENPVSLNDEASCFQKLLTASKSDVEKIVKREYNELMTQLLKEKDAPEACFLETALELLQERRKAVTERRLIEDMCEVLTLEDKHEMSSFNHNYAEDNYESYNPIETMIDPFGDEDQEDNYYSQSENANKYSLTLSEEKTNNSVDEIINDDVMLNFPEIPAMPLDSPKNNIQKQAKNQGKEYYYFYQAIDGQNIYLSTINVQMLVREYGNLENCPHEINAKVIELEGLSMNESLRHRLRYLCHLPLTCEFQTVELQMKPLISPAVFDFFIEELNKRDLMRKRKLKEERRRERQLEREENKKLGKFPGVRYHLDSMSHFPSCSTTVSICSDEDPPLLSNSLSSDSLTEQVNETPPACDQKCNDSSTAKTDNQPASFAQMLREGKTKQQSVSSSPPKDACKQDGLKSVVSTPSSEEENYEPTRMFPHSFGDVIEAALLNSINQHNSVTENPESKKKKGKKTLLFSTSMNRRQ